MTAGAKFTTYVGVALKAEHYRDVIQMHPRIGFFEVHAENYMGGGGPPHRYLRKIRESYALSLHGVGASLGGESRLDSDHLRRLKDLIVRYEPALFSEHLAWSTHNSLYMSDLLPLPYNLTTLQRLAANIDELQSAVGRQVLLENPASYLTFDESSWPEPEFISELVSRTGCGLLLDLNNVLVSAHNIGFSSTEYLDSYPLRYVKELHLAGHTAVSESAGGSILIDSHNSMVSDEVWNMFADVCARIGACPTLIERDANIPTLGTLIQEAHRAADLIGEVT